MAGGDSETRDRSPLDTTELLDLIFGCLQPLDLLACLLACRRWQAVAAMHLWRRPWTRYLRSWKRIADVLARCCEAHASEEAKTEALCGAGNSMSSSSSSSSSSAVVGALSERRRRQPTINYAQFVRELDLSQLYYVVNDDFIMTITRACPLLQIIALDSPKQLTDLALHGGICKADCRTRLRKLSLRGCTRITQDALVLLAQSCRMLEELDLRDGPRVDNRVLQTLGRLCVHLVSLSISQSILVNDDGLAAFSGLSGSESEMDGSVDIHGAVVGCTGAATSLSLELKSQTRTPAIADVQQHQHQQRQRQSAAEATAMSASRDEGAISDDFFTSTDADSGQNVLITRNRAVLDANSADPHSHLHLLPTTAAGDIDDDATTARAALATKPEGISETQHQTHPSGNHGHAGTTFEKRRNNGDCAKRRGMLHLDVSRCPDLTDCGFRVMERSRHLWCSLRSLDVSFCHHITDATMTVVAGVARGLKTLRIEGCLHVSDRGVDVIVGGCNELSLLCVDPFYGKISSENLKDVQASRPSLRIFRGSEELRPQSLGPWSSSSSSASASGRFGLGAASSSGASVGAGSSCLLILVD